MIGINAAHGKARKLAPWRVRCAVPFDCSGGLPPGDKRPKREPSDKIEKAAAAVMLGIFFAILGASVVMGAMLPLVERIWAYPLPWAP